MNKNFRVIYFFIIAIYSHFIFAQGNAAPAADDTKKEELARVIILPFSDRTNTKNFVYMSESLSDAISTSMLKNFTFNRVDPKEVQKVTYEVDQYVKKNKIKQKPKNKADKNDGKRVKTAAELQLDEDQLNFARKISSDLKSDIVIYGNYNYNNETNELIFNTSIYVAASDAVRDLDENNNVVDNTIFKATDKVAKNIVDTINIMIEEAAGAKKQVAENDQETKKPDEKKALTKNIGKGPVYDWAAKKFLISLGMGTSLIPTPRTVNLLPNEYRINNVYIDVRFWPIPSLQTSLRFRHLDFETQNTNYNHSNLSVQDLMLYGGYGFYIQKRLYAYGDLGAGYYSGELNYNVFASNSTGGSYTRYKVQNPIFGARLGVDLLLLSFLSAGLSTTFDVYYDRPLPILNLNLLFNMGVTF
ncbi:MAG: hypothetical protein OEV78_05330 [Spirochaetia bacterium]|nr:hypothetical protein [Spirochaetia bacterium]